MNKHTVGEGNGNPLQYSCLENPMDGGAWWATVHRVAKSRTRLSLPCACPTGLQALWQLTHVAADQLHHLIDDTQLFHFPPDLQIFCLSWAKYACNSRWHSSQGPLFLWDTKGGKRQVLVCYAGSVILMVLVCPYESQFVHDFVYTQLSLKCYSCWLPENSVATPDTKITALYRLLQL